MSALESYLDSFDAEPGYLNWASFGPLSPAVRDEVHADAELLGSGRHTGIGLVASHSDEAKDLLAELLDCPRDEITLQPSTTYGLMHAFYGLAGELLLSPHEFPSLTVAAQRAQDAIGELRVRPLDTPDGIVTVDAVRAQLSDETTAVAVSLVDYRTGAVSDLGALRDVIGDRLLIVDAVQGFGVVDADYDAADVVCGNGYKWLRAGRGTGFARFSAIARDRIRPVLSGFAGSLSEYGVPGVGAPRPGADAFVIAPEDTLAAARLASSLQELRDVGVGAVAAEVADRARHIFALADRYEVPVLTPRDAHAGIVSLVPEAQDAGVLAAALANHGVTATARGGVIRLSAHAGTGADTLHLLGDALAETAGARALAAPVIFEPGIVLEPDAGIVDPDHVIES
ncbi:selenocysteine lyase/cysteine desulfurase [Microbacterium telephonicum]|uniref:Selenocysteine lyase/cysteine desulfurase n=1 Tax=Microbacterium telephonicum TaxID=1714841 RepID=A0A498C1K9_9MICO|nr:selenocysteine lyase/cysteine desulfurase [Microbacterium telephonicum]